METVSNENLLNLNGKTAVVTGGARGIGLGISNRLAMAGANIVIADYLKETAEEGVSQITQKGFKAVASVVDISSEEDVQRMVNEAVASFGRIDILVNNAGIYPNKMVMDMTTADFDKVISVNLKGVYLCTKYVAAQMIKQGQGGKIINVTSIDSIHPSSKGLAHYDASKHGVWGFTKNVALELASHKIWVNAIAPGGISTPGTQEIQKNTPLPQGVDMSKLLETFLAKIPMQRMGDPDEIGKVALFLASDMSSYMTGSQIVVDGGVLLS